MLNKGDQVEAVVRDVDAENQRISLSIKELLPDEWERFANHHSLGETMEGDVSSIAEFSIFVRLEHDIEGLHRLFSGKFLSEGIREILGEKVRKTKSTTSLSKSDFSEYIMNIEAETGIKAPDTKNYFD